MLSAADNPSIFLYNINIAIPNFIQTVSVTIFFYYSILHFEDEVTHIWSPKWAWGKAMFLVTRYSGALFNSLLLVSMINNVDNVIMRSDGVAVDHLMSYTEDLACLDGYLYTGMGMAAILLAEGILTLRVYAIYNKSKRVLVFLTVLLFASFALSVTQASGVLTIALENIGYELGGGSGQPYQPFVISPFKLMSISCTFNSQPAAAIVWAMTVIIESVLFTMVLVKSQKKGNLELHRYSAQDNLLIILAKDSTEYYGIIFVCTIIPTIVSFLYETNIVFAIEFNGVLSTFGCQLNSFQAVVITVMTSFAPQMIINLRRKFYQYTPGDGTGTVVLPGGISFQSQELSWDARRPQSLNSTVFDTSVLDY